MEEGVVNYEGGWPEGKWEWRKFNELEEARVVLGTRKGKDGGEKGAEGTLKRPQSSP